MNYPTDSEWIGIDISKSTLDIATYNTNLKIPDSLNNDAKGHRKLIKLLLKHPKSKVIFEATGGYEKPLLLSLQEAGIYAVRKNPAQVRAFAKAEGLIAKTDKLDARLLARYGENFKPEATLCVDPELAELQDLIKYRSHIRDEVQRAKAQLEHGRSKRVSEMAHRHLTSLKKRLEVITREVVAYVHNSEKLKPQIEVLTQVKGVAELTATWLLASMPELGTLNRKQAAALAGLAPMNSDSGKTERRRKTHGGRTEIRRALHMSAVVAARFEPKLRDDYQDLIKRGKPVRVARTAITRKLLVYLNSLMRNYLQDSKTKS
jgi:transposase